MPHGPLSRPRIAARGTRPRRAGLSRPRTALAHGARLGTPALTGQDLQRDAGRGQGLADRARALGLLSDLGEPFRGHALRGSPHRQLDAGDPEAPRRVGAEADLCTDVEGLPAATRFAQHRGELHREAGAVRGGDELLRAGHPARVVGRPPGEIDLVGGDAGTDQFHRALAVLKATGPCGASATSRHRFSLSSGRWRAATGGRRAAGLSLPPRGPRRARGCPVRGYAVAPPSIARAAPVMNAASSLSKYVTNEASSLSAATRPVGFGAGSGSSPSSGTPSRLRYSGVSALPVTSALTRTPARRSPAPPRGSARPRRAWRRCTPACQLCRGPRRRC